MKPLTLQQVAEWSNGRLFQGVLETSVARVCTDSRQVQAGDLFVAISGEKFDGHDFVPEVARKGAAAVMIENSRAATISVPCGVVAVENVRKALGSLAANYRASLNVRTIAVGGSNGKTTTKELLASVLRQRFKTLSSEASFNNDIGVPVTLMRMETSHEAAVLEAGTNHPGELAPLVKMIAPLYGVITSIGREHLEFFGDLRGVAEEEGTLAEAVLPQGKVFLNGDSPEMERIARRSRAQVVRIGWTEANDWRARRVRMDGEGMRFEINAPYEAFSGEYRIKLLGRHQITNAMLALAVGVEMGLTRVEVARGLMECAAPKMRLQLKDINGVRVLDDSYNANADSVIAALETLCDLPCTGRRIAVLGDMAELGQESHAAHHEVGERAAELGLAHLFAVGQMAGVVSAAAQGMGFTEVSEHPDVVKAARAVSDYVQPGDLVLVKASRAVRLERVIEQLAASGDSGASKSRLLQTAIFI